MRSLSSTRASLGRALLLGGSGSNSAANSASTAAITAAAAAAYSALVPQQQPQSDLPALLAAAARRHFGSGTDYSDGRADSHEFEPRGGAAAVGAGRNKCVMHCDEGFGTASAWRTTQPRLGELMWPSVPRTVPRVPRRGNGCGRHGAGRPRLRNSIRSESAHFRGEGMEGYKLGVWRVSLIPPAYTLPFPPP